MSKIAVIIPSWRRDRVSALAMSLFKLSSQQVEVNYYCSDPLPDGSLTSPVEGMAAVATKVMETNPDVLAFFHDDMDINAFDWDQTIIEHFAAHPRCGLAGFGGGVGFATDDIYLAPYDYRQLARIGFVSNMREAEQHGRRVTVPTRVAALDGFSMICSREFYERSGGWGACAKDHIFFHMDDAWISCRAAELGYETWMLPVACHHQGGQTSVGMKDEYETVCRRLGYRDGQDLYDQAHRRIYERFSRILPIRVPHGGIDR